MKKMVALVGLALTACAPLHPKPVSDLQKQCAEMATDEAMPYLVFVGPVTGNIVRSKLYTDCINK